MLSHRIQSKDEGSNSKMHVYTIFVQMQPTAKSQGVVIGLCQLVVTHRGGRLGTDTCTVAHNKILRARHFRADFLPLEQIL